MEVKMTLEQSLRLSKQLMRAVKTDVHVQCLGNRPLEAEVQCRTVPLWKAHRCFYCGFYLCPECSKQHFESAATNDRQIVIDLRKGWNDAEEKNRTLQSALAAAEKERDTWKKLYKSCGQYCEENKCAEAEAAEQSLALAQDKINGLETRLGLLQGIEKERDAAIKKAEENKELILQESERAGAAEREVELYRRIVEAAKKIAWLVPYDRGDFHAALAALPSSEAGSKTE